LKIPK
jgi:hypothetical protein